MISMRKILIIEDNKDLAGAIEGLLKLKGFETFLARDGVSGIEQARKHKPDLVLLDIMLPKLNGFEVCRMLKTDSALRHIPVLREKAPTVWHSEKPEERLKYLVCMFRRVF